MIFFDLIAWSATVLGILMYAPQAIKTIRSRQTKDLSKATFTIVAFSTAFWAIYTLDVNSYQGWVMNTIILFLMIPIINLIYSKKIFILITILLSSLFLVSILLFIPGINLGEVLRYIFVIFASLGISVSFYFQIFKTFREKNASSLSILSLIVILATNLLWSIYWLGQIVLKGNDATFIIAFIASLTAGLSQIPLIFAFYKFKNKKISSKKQISKTNSF